jgi:hypothetical protein
MIKVGQIYQEPSEYGFKYVITKIRPYNDKVIRKYYRAICDDGDVFDKLFEIDIKQDNLIAEYPTWQEAVNSKEFKND